MGTTERIIQAKAILTDEFPPEFFPASTVERLFDAILENPVLLNDEKLANSIIEFVDEIIAYFEIATSGDNNFDDDDDWADVVPLFGGNE